MTPLDDLLGYQQSNPDSRIRLRLEASRQGMLQLEALRVKHQKLMKVIQNNYNTLKALLIVIVFFFFFCRKSVIFFQPRGNFFYLHLQ